MHRFVVLVVHRQRSEQHAEQRTHQHQGGYHFYGDLPTLVYDQLRDDRREKECAQPGTADGDTGGHRSVFIEITCHAHDSRQIDHTETKTCENDTITLIGII